MGLALGSIDITSIYFGTKRVTRIYVGETIIYDLVPWTPDQLTTAAWFDADDSETITLNGTTVSQWDDKSGNENHLTQAVATDQPTYESTGLNSRPTVQFDGINDFFQQDGVAAAIGSNNFTVMMVGKIPTTFTDDPFSYVLRLVGNNTRYYLFYNDTLGLFSGWGASNSLLDNFTVGAGTDQMVGSQRDGTTCTNFQNGTDLGSLTETFPNPFTTFVITQVLEGIKRNLTNAAISELIFSSGDAWTLEERQLVEGYLAWKWGLEDRLPVDHPYKNSAPTRVI